jgi:uncharacterized protein YlzI (FlbEa/FlbD family)
MRATKMARFIQLRDSQNIPIDVNPDHIEMIKPSSDADPDNPAVIQLTSGKAMKVRETVDEIKLMIRKAGQRKPL